MVIQTLSLNVQKITKHAALFSVRVQFRQYFFTIYSNFYEFMTSGNCKKKTKQKKLFKNTDQIYTI